MSRLGTGSDAAEGLGVLARHAARLPLLSRAEEIRLARRIKRGDLEAKQLMVESNLRLVLAVARPFAGQGVPLSDLVQEGTIGLVRAVERFDHRRGARFSTYAVVLIRRSILDAVGGERTIRIPTQARRQIAAVLRAEAELRRAGHLPSEKAISNRTGLSMTSVRALRDAARVTASLDQRVGDEGQTYGELVADPSCVDPAERAGAAEQLADLRSMLRLLPERHRQVLLRRYGLGRFRPQTHREISRWLGVGEERSRQLEREALHRLYDLGTRAKRAA